MPSDTTTPVDKASIWGRVIFRVEPSATAARALLKLRFAKPDRDRMQALSAKARAGSLTADDQREIDAYERVGCLLDVLHSKARRVLKRCRTP